MAQFPVTPERARIMERLPDYEVRMTPEPQTVSVTSNGRTIARSNAALRVAETRHADVYYLPREDVDLTLFERTDHQTYCPFKGHASYWSLNADGESIENVVWSYETPYAEVDGLKDYLSFYTDKVTVSAG